MPDLIVAATATAKALAGQVNVARAVGINLDYLRSNPGRALSVAQACVALGDVSSAFALLDGYYFGAGPWAPVSPPAGDPDRQTDALFQPPMAALWRDRRFDRLLARVGLTHYWQQSATRPDYRRANLAV
ncbi:hypothetical protein [Sphingomonas xanthus]|uniref:Uncharacterized protein n=1 Tax=Sphingomonas xanthus TaxID=2594473 RepID=A0A516IT94_9SPHN|nr:hypothetical protein [Sphingomonas xanthus]QDP20113.1 hypothetical protein FMM02_09215 [Sphingomonas xanthus]